MRLTTVLLIASLMQVSAAGFAQKFSLTTTKESLKNVFAEVQKQTGFSVLAKSEYLNNSKPVTISIKDVPLEEALTKILAGQNLSFSIEDKVVLIKEKEVSLLDRLSKVILNLVRDLTVRGVVKDQDGKPLPNASIRIKGKSAVINTNQNGEFEVRDVPEDAVLLVSYVGYKTLEIPVKGAVAPLEIKLNVATGELEEVNVTYSTGYQSLPKERATGSFVLIDSALLNRKVSTNILERLDGVVSGLKFNTNPNLGANEPAISIRTRSTLFSNTFPLIVVDNFPYTGDISSINPNDVESITILKDAAAASIWGAFSGNGVIVITTKKGRYNKSLNIGFNSNITIGTKPNLYDVPKLSSANYIDFEKYLFENGFYTATETSTAKLPLSPAVEIFIQKREGKITDQQMEAQLNNLRNTDKRDDLDRYFYQTSINQQHNLNFTGGSENQQYFFSAGYDKNVLNLKRNDFDRVTINANNTYGLFKNRLEITSGVSFSKNRARNNGLSSVSGNLNTLPYLDLVDDNGQALTIAERYRLSYIDTIGQGRLLDWHYLPYNELKINNHTELLTEYRINAGLNFKVIPGLNVNLKYQYNKGMSEQLNLYHENSYYARNLINQYSQISSNGTVVRAIPLGGMLDKFQDIFEAHNFRGTFNFNRSWNEIHSLTAIAGLEMNKRSRFTEKSFQYGYNEDMAKGVVVDYFKEYPTYPLFSLIPIPNPALNPTSAFHNRYISYFANASYSYKNKYTFSASGRKDESNLFGVKTNQRGVPLWSAGISWDISKEAFYKVELLPVLKIRLTNGYNGNVNSSLSAVTTIVNGATNLYGAPTYLINNPPNPSLKWEKVRNLNAAVDFGFKNNRVSGRFEFYKKWSEDLIGTSPIDPTTGITTFTGNTANMEGSGVDLELNTINIHNKIRWTTNLLFSYAKDKVTKYNLKINGLFPIVNGQLNPIVGNPTLSIYSYKWAGLDPANGDPQGYLNDKISKAYSSFSSSTDLKNLNYHGTARPTMFGGLRNNLSWKQLELSFNIKYSFNYFFRNPSMGYTDILSGSANGGTDEQYIHRWQKPGDESFTTIPGMVNPNALMAGSRDQFYQYSDLHIERADHIRLQDIQLNYQFSNRLVQQLSFKNIRVYGYVNNLGIIWKATKSKLDPDFVTGFVSPRTYALGIMANF